MIGKLTAGTWLVLLAGVIAANNIFAVSVVKFYAILGVVLAMVLSYAAFKVLLEE